VNDGASAEVARPKLFQSLALRGLTLKNRLVVPPMIAVGRQSQFNPNIAHHWAHDLGINGRFEDWSQEYGWWLEKRIPTMEGFATPTGVVTRRL
jgi:2,4-dienoyl-CoA reductase-like NADH-dependent reductase (Old Yellow Enzyme family)